MAQNPKSKTTNIILFDTIRGLKKLSVDTGVNVWKAVAMKLSKSASQRPEVNLARIEKYVNESETIIVPGKVLGEGVFTKKNIKIVGFKASESAIAKINATGSEFIEIKDYISKKPSNKIRIIG